MDGFRQHGHAVSRTFAFPNHDLVTHEVHVLDSQSKALHQSHSSAIHQPRHKPWRTAELIEQCVHFPLAEHYRQSRRHLRFLYVIEPGQRDA